MKKIKQQMENLGKKESDSPRAPQTNQMGPVQPADPAGQQQDRGGLNEEEKLERDRQMFDAHTFQALSPVRTDEGWSAYLQVDDSRSWVSEGDKLYALDVVDITEHKVTLEARYGLQRSYPYTYGGEN